ncbi:hypothetical protein INR49_007120 [Caranx melampygus]|nr:hypothetical protein INR49_007120 [Caranx melampygus]
MASRKRGLQADNGEQDGALSAPKQQQRRHVAAKGIPLKNIKMLAGVPLIGWVLRAAANCDRFNSIWVSTDHDEIEKVAKTWGPRSTAGAPRSPKTRPRLWRPSRKVDVICHIQATSPCLPPYHIREALDMILEQGYDSVFSVVRRHQFRWQEVKKGCESTGQI